jgi:hypothetical protein
MTPNVRSFRLATGRTARPLEAAVAAGSALAALGAISVAYKTSIVATPGTGAAPVTEPVSVLLPARNEAPRIAACLRSLAAQEGIADLEILVLDDGSTDGTGAIARELAADDPRIRVLHGEPLPPGWLGKPHACAQLAAAARGSVLVFVDADVTLAPQATAAAVAMLRDRGLDLLSPFPRQLSGTFAERLYQPLALWTWIACLPVLDGRAAARPSSCVVSGQFVVVDRAAYEAVGGHAAIREALIEDYALGAAFRAAGRTGGAADGSQIASCRMYEGWAAMRDGHTRWLGTAIPSRRRLAGTVGILALTYLVPPAAALRGSKVGLAGYGAAVAGRALAARRFGERVWPDCAAHPVSIAVACGFMADGRRRRRLGRTSWKGRPV